MAPRRTTQTHTTEARILVLPDCTDMLRSDSMPGPAAQTDQAVMGHSPSDRTQATGRTLRYLIIVANIIAWLATIAAIRFFFF